MRGGAVGPAWLSPPNEAFLVPVPLAKQQQQMMSLSGDSYKITDDEANKMFE